MIGNVCLRPVGTRGGRGDGWGPGACPRAWRVRQGFLLTRWILSPGPGQAPGPLIHPTQPLVPTGRLTSRAAFGRHHSSGGGAASVPMGMITPFSWQNSLGPDLAGDEELSSAFEPGLNK